MKIYTMSYGDERCFSSNIRLEHISTADLRMLATQLTAEADLRDAEARLRTLAKEIADRHASRDVAASLGTTGAAAWVVDAVLEALKAGAAK